MGFQPPSEIRRYLGLTEVSGGLRHLQGAPKCWTKDTESTSVSHASGVPAPQSQPLCLMQGLAQSGELPSQPPHCLPNGP